MPNFNSAFRSEVIRLARKEGKELAEPARRASLAARREVVALKRRVQELERLLRRLASTKPSTQDETGSTEGRNYRFRAQGVKANRDRLGLSAEDFGKLLDVSSQSVYLWESGRSKPRPAVLAKLVELRALGKRAALARLLSLAEPSRKKSR